MRLLYLFFLALVIRILAFSVLIHELPAAKWQDRILTANQDSLEYQRLAHGLNQGNGYVNEKGEPTAYRPPLYPMFMAFIYQVTHSENPLWIIFTQMLLSALAAVLIEQIGSQIFSKSTGFLAALLICVNPHLAYFSCQLLSETLFQFLFLLSLLMTIRSSFWSAGISGMTASLAALCRSTGFLFIPCNIFLTLIQKGAGKRTKVLVMIGFSLLTLAPWVSRNYRVSGEITITSTNGGKNLLRGLNQQWLHSIAVKGFTFDDHLYDAMPEWQRNRAQIHYARNIILGQPAYFARVTLSKWLHFFSPLPSRDYPYWFRILSFGYVTPLFILGFWGLWKTRNPYGAYFAILFILFSFAHALFFTNIRFRVPIVDSALAVFAARSILDYLFSKASLSPNQLQ